jgi:hypothetical protein
LTKLKVELFGSARRVVGAKEVDLAISSTDTYRDVAAKLATDYPSLLGRVIEPGTYDLIEPYFFNVDAKRVVRDLDQRPDPGKPLLLFFVDAGG